MSQTEQFGDFLLFQRLEQDPLGETYRAARVGRAGGPVLLKVINGAGIDRGRLAAVVARRESLCGSLTGPAILPPSAVASADGTPHASYPYVHGRSLAEVLKQSKRRNLPLPGDHALRIVERMAVALAAAEAQRMGGRQLVHGFVVPPLIHLSTEGEVRVLGFELGEALRSQATAGPLRDAFGAYLAPEVLSGSELSSSESAYALGVFLLTLLTGKPLDPARPLSALLAEARVESDDAPLPADLVLLLRQSLAPAGKRIPDATTWHAEVARLLGEREYSPTTFNLAFYMHSLLHEELEEEKQGFPAAPPTPPVPPEERSVSDMQLERPRSRRGLWIGAAAAIGAVVLAGWAVLATWRSADRAASVQAATATSPVDTSPTPDPVDDLPPAPPAGPTPEEIEERIRSMVEDRYAAVERNIQSEFDQQLRGLQQQLAEARERAAERSARLQAARERQAADAESPVADAGEDRGRSEEATSQPDASAAPALDAAAAIATEPEPAQQVAEEPEPSTVQPGDLVDIGTPGVRPPVRIATPAVEYPIMARRMKREGTVQLRVLVDENGLPADVQVVGGQTGLGFGDAAVQTVRQMRWRPATQGGVPVKVWIPATVDFRL